MLPKRHKNHLVINIICMKEKSFQMNHDVGTIKADKFQFL